MRLLEFEQKYATICFFCYNEHIYEHIFVSKFCDETGVLFAYKHTNASNTWRSFAKKEKLFAWILENWDTNGKREVRSQVRENSRMGAFGLVYVHVESGVSHQSKYYDRVGWSVEKFERCQEQCRRAI